VQQLTITLRRYLVFVLGEQREVSKRASTLDSKEEYGKPILFPS
jgi:hypothetical protein